MIGVVIGGKSAWMVDKDCPKAFEYKGGYYVLDKDFYAAYEHYMMEDK